MPKVTLPTSLARYTQQCTDLTIAGDTLHTVLTQLVNDHPALQPYIFDDQQQLNGFVVFYINGEDARYLKQQATPVSASDVIAIAPATAGG